MNSRKLLFFLLLVLLINAAYSKTLYKRADGEDGGDDGGDEPGDKKDDEPSEKTTTQAKPATTTVKSTTIKPTQTKPSTTKPVTNAGNDVATPTKAPLNPSTKAPPTSVNTNNKNNTNTSNKNNANTNTSNNVNTNTSSNVNANTNANTNANANINAKAPQNVASAQNVSTAPTTVPQTNNVAPPVDPTAQGNLSQNGGLTPDNNGNGTISVDNINLQKGNQGMSNTTKGIIGGGVLVALIGVIGGFFLIKRNKNNSRDAKTSISPVWPQTTTDNHNNDDYTRAIKSEPLDIGVPYTGQYDQQATNYPYTSPTSNTNNYGYNDNYQQNDLNNYSQNYDYNQQDAYNNTPNNNYDYNNDYQQNNNYDNYDNYDYGYQQNSQNNYNDYQQKPIQSRKSCDTTDQIYSTYQEFGSQQQPEVPEVPAPLAHKTTNNSYNYSSPYEDPYQNTSYNNITSAAAAASPNYQNSYNSPASPVSPVIEQPSRQGSTTDPGKMRFRDKYRNREGGSDNETKPLSRYASYRNQLM